MGRPVTSIPEDTFSRIDCEGYYSPITDTYVVFYRPTGRRADFRRQTLLDAVGNGPGAVEVLLFGEQAVAP